MFDISKINKRYFEIQISVEDDEGQEHSAHLEVEPPRIKALKKITALSKVREEDAMNDLSAAIAMILNKNKEKYKVPDEIIDNLDFDQMDGILSEYFEWLSKEKNSKN